MKNKIWVAIIIMVVSTIAISIAIIGIEKKITDKSLIERQVSAQEIKDVTPPIIKLKGNKEITLKQGETYKEPGYTAIDDMDGSVVGRVEIVKNIINDKQYKLIYTVTDKSGNKATEERMIHIETISQVEEKNTNTQKNDQNTNNNENKKEDNEKDNNKQVANQKDNQKQETNQKNDSNTNQNNTGNKNNIPTNEKGVIYLTFDDGPTNSSTPKILDILKKHNVKATFFILNYNQNTEALVKREVAEGHSVGIHGYSHDYKKIYTSENTYMENLNKLQEKIYKSTGVKTTLTRFPGGSSNTISKFNPKIMTRLSKLVVQKGYQYYDWNVDSNDAGGAKNADAVYKSVTKGLSKKRRNIVLMHDFSGNDKTIEALEKIIEYGKKNGYTFKKITSDTRMMQHTINN